VNEYVAHIRKLDRETQYLKDHLSEVGELSAQFASKLNLKDIGCLLGLLHDFGKYSKAFQVYINSAEGRIRPDEDDYVDASKLKGKIDHSSAGAQYAWRRLKGIGGLGQGELCGQILALCIASHHSGLIDCLSEGGDYTFGKRMCKDDKKTRLQACLNNADVALLSRVDELLNVNVVKQMFGAIHGMVSFPRNESEAISKVDAFTLGMITRFLFSCLVDADRLNSAEFENPSRKVIRQERWLDWSIAIQRLDLKINSFAKVSRIDGIRKNISDNCKSRALDKQGIYTLTVPTGGGKTLASLRYALHHAKKHNWNVKAFPDSFLNRFFASLVHT